MAGAYVGALRGLERVFRVKTNKQTPWEDALARPNIPLTRG